MRKIFLCLVVIGMAGRLFGQTNVSAGNVSGTWTRTGSPYKVNGDIVVPSGSTLTIEPGVKVEFAQGKYLNVAGRILASGKSGSIDSIWFTKQNPKDTGSWRGIKFLSPNSVNDTSVFRYCVFSYAKGIYDTTWYKMSGALTISKWNKVKINNCTFYKNEAGYGASIFITGNSKIAITSCQFKLNLISIVWLKIGNGWQTYNSPSGSAVAVEQDAFAYIDSCSFYNNQIGKEYNMQNSSFIDGSVVDIEANDYYKKKSGASIKNSLFVSNEGYTINANGTVDVEVQNCVFRDAVKNKARNIIVSQWDAKLKTKNCQFIENTVSSVVFVDDAIYNSEGDLFSGNFSHSIISSDDGSILSRNVNLNRSKIVNNSGGPLKGLIGLEVSRMESCLVVNNKFDCIVSGGDMINNTIAFNQTVYEVLFPWNFTFYANNIIWGNVSDTFGTSNILVPQGYTQFFYNNIIQNDSNGFVKKSRNGTLPVSYVNNTKSNPLFKKPSALGISYNQAIHDFSLINTCDTFSPAIDGGYRDYFFIGSFDINYNPRVFGDSIDIGAYEDMLGPNEIKLKELKLNDTICKGENVVFAVKASGKGLVKEWQSSDNGKDNWTKINGISDKDTLRLVNPDHSMSNKFYRVVLNGTCDQMISDSGYFILHDIPSVKLGKDTAVCKGAQMRLSTNIQGTYLWQDGSKAQNLNQVINKDTVWTLQVKDVNACVASDTIRINANPLPIVDLGPDFNLHWLKSVQLDAGNQTTYLWDNASTVKTRNFFGKDLGVGQHNVWVKVSNSFGCESRDTVLVNVVNNSSIESSFGLNDQIYPVPFSDKLTMSFETNASVQIFNQEGKLMFKDDALNSQEYKIDTGEWAGGNYVVLINYGDQIKCLKIQK